MSEIVISAQNLSKKYVIGPKALRRDFNTLRGDVGQVAKELWHRAKGLIGGGGHQERPESKEFWALKDVNFQIRRGEVTGIIGGNGAGKSTLLKLLSGISEPSEGRVEIKGNVASLLEVGTGFHPDLTGRENIFLNGAILGMSGAEVRKKFDEIVAFAEIEDFMNTPVKRYSNGMYVRLAFSIAAHLEPDILVVDEVLAVGDAEFQKKCLGKIEEVSKNKGRTILLVSHNMGMVSSLCRNAILLDHGRVSFSGSAQAAIANYYSEGLGHAYSADFEGRSSGAAEQEASLLSAQVQDMRGRATGEVNVRAGCKVMMRFRANREMRKKAYAIFRFHSGEGQCAFVSAEYCGPFAPGVYEASCLVPPDLLNCGVYYVDLALIAAHVGDQYCFDEPSGLCIVAVESSSQDADPSFDYIHGTAGLLRPKLNWTINQIG